MMKKQDTNSDFTKKYLVQCGKRLKVLRKAKGFTNYEQFAYLNNIGRSQYGKYEKGADMRLSTFIRVLKALEVSPIEFFSEGFEMPKSNKKKK